MRESARRRSRAPDRELLLIRLSIISTFREKIKLLLDFSRIILFRADFVVSCRALLTARAVAIILETLDVGVRVASP